MRESDEPRSNPEDDAAQDKEALDQDHFLSPEERLRVAMALQ
jgi:hypothetical protein